MTIDLALVLLLLLAAVAMFVCNKPRMDAVALLMIVLLPLTGVITTSEALAGFQRPEHRVDRGVVRHRRGAGAHRRGAAPGRLARPDRRQQQHTHADPADGGGRRTRRAHEFHRGGCHFHSGGAADFQEHWHPAEPADDAVERCRADQWHVDPGGHRAEPRGERRADAPGRAGFRLFQLYAVRPAGAGAGDRLHVFRAALAAECRAGSRRRSAPYQPAALDRPIPARRARTSCARAAGLCGDRSAAPGFPAPRLGNQPARCRASRAFRHRTDTATAAH